MGEKELRREILKDRKFLLVARQIAPPFAGFRIVRSNYTLQTLLFGGAWPVCKHSLMATIWPLPCIAPIEKALNGAQTVRGLKLSTIQ